MGLGTATAIADVTVVSKIPYPVGFCEGFESGSFDGTAFGYAGNKPAVTRDVAREGKYAMKVVLNRYKSDNPRRSEAQANGTKTVQVGASSGGGEYWYGFSIYLPSSYVPNPTWEIVAQWHSVPDTDIGEVGGKMNPPVSLHTEKGLWRVSTMWDAHPITNKYTTGYDGTKYYDLGAYKTNVWTDFVFHIKWSPFSDGVLEVWKDGKQVVTRHGPIGFNDKIAPWFKVGIYNGWGNKDAPSVVSERTIYHDSVCIAGKNGKYEDVAPGRGGGVPRPLPPNILSVNDKAAPSTEDAR
jgi:hypothetical protein